MLIAFIVYHPKPSFQESVLLFFVYEVDPKSHGFLLGLHSL